MAKNKKSSLNIPHPVRISMSRTSSQNNKERQGRNPDMWDIKTIFHNRATLKVPQKDNTIMKQIVMRPPVTQRNKK